MNKTPAVRFIGFAEDWEQRKLGDLLQTLPFKQFLKEPEPDGKYEIIQQGNEPVIGCANGTPCGDYKDVVIFGDHTLSLYKPQHPFFVATDGVRIVKGQQDTDGYYLLSLLERYKPQSEGYKRYYSILADTNCITTYNISEQEKIGVFFKLLANLITLHQRKYEKLKNIKKSMLYKMFPKNGSNVPEIRFKGFTDAWEQRKLNEITDVRDGTHDSPKYVQEGHPFITSKNVSNGFINYDDVQYVTDEDYEKINKRSKVDVHDILMGMIGTIGNLALIRKKPDFAIKNVALIKYTGDIEYNYLYQALQADCVTSQLSTGMDGGTQKFVSLKKIRELDIPFPEECEQKKIGAYFSNLDTLITLHHRKLEKLEQIKQAMLHKMFV